MKTIQPILCIHINIFLHTKAQIKIYIYIILINVHIHNCIHVHIVAHRHVHYNILCLPVVQPVAEAQDHHARHGGEGDQLQDAVHLAALQQIAILYSVSCKCSSSSSSSSADSCNK